MTTIPCPSLPLLFHKPKYKRDELGQPSNLNHTILFLCILLGKRIFSIGLHSRQ